MEFGRGGKAAYGASHQHHNKYLALYKSDQFKVIMSNNSHLKMNSLNPAFQRMVELESTKNKHSIRSHVAKYNIVLHKEDKNEDKKKDSWFFKNGIKPLQDKLQTARNSQTP